MGERETGRVDFSDFDRHMMDVALHLARRGLGTTAPNPAVGAVVADPATGELIARGWTQPGGRPHAETEALKRAGARAQGATLYVTLEPCAHFGRTPPCADAAVAAGIARVVVGVGDPDPRTHGDGIARLEAAGIAVEVGLRGEEARWVTLGHILRITERRPFVQLKMALAADGSVPRGAGGQPLMVTSPQARALAHRLRAETDAILVGAGTARDDDPELTCRLPGLAGRSPVRVVLSRTLDLSPNLKLVRTAREVPTWIFAGGEADPDRVCTLEAAGVRVFSFPLPPGLPHEGGGEGGAWPLADMLAQLAGEGVTRLLVEGGAAVWRAFAQAGLADEVVLFQAGAAAGRRDDAEQAAALALSHAPGLDLAPAGTHLIGPDRVTTFRVRRAGPA
jgi:diaminohydroxyphosphoribosylaminopyrimidine deaminase/5-amino-6-(5-phosphoribosylamino)uracil reductase